MGHETSTKVASTTVVSSSASESATSSEHKSCIEKAWREGVDYFKVENSIVCHDGESIQGSHGECIKQFNVIFLKINFLLHSCVYVGITIKNPSSSLKSFSLLTKKILYETSR